MSDEIIPPKPSHTRAECKGIGDHAMSETIIELERMYLREKRLKETYKNQLDLLNLSDTDQVAQIHELKQQIEKLQDQKNAEDKIEIQSLQKRNEALKARLDELSEKNQELTDELLQTAQERDELKKVSDGMHKIHERNSKLLDKLHKSNSNVLKGVKSKGI